MVNSLTEEATLAKIKYIIYYLAFQIANWLFKMTLLANSFFLHVMNLRSMYIIPYIYKISCQTDFMLLIYETLLLL